MTSFNLLPWREQQQAKLKQKWLCLVLLALILTGALIVGIHLGLVHRIQAQQASNQRLNQQIEQLNIIINKQEQQQQQQQARALAIKTLAEIAHSTRQKFQLLLFLPQLATGTVCFTQLEVNNKQLQLTGLAANSSDLSKLTQQLKNNSLFSSSYVQEVISAHAPNSASKQFLLIAYLQHRA